MLLVCTSHFENLCCQISYKVFSRPRSQRTFLVPGWLAAFLSPSTQSPCFPHLSTLTFFLLVKALQICWQCLNGVILALQMGDGLMKVKDIVWINHTTHSDLVSPISAFVTRTFPVLPFFSPFPPYLHSHAIDSPVNPGIVNSLLGSHASPDKGSSLLGELLTHTNPPNDVCEIFQLNWKIFSRPVIIVIDV